MTVWIVYARRGDTNVVLHVCATEEIARELGSKKLQAIKAHRVFDGVHIAIEEREVVDGSAPR